MLIDANELPDNSQIDSDICIAGSGPAGITLAAELANAPLRVCLVESGGLSRRGGVPACTVAEQVGLPIDLVKFQQHEFGGASNRWGGLSGRWLRLKPLDPIDFEARPWVANSGWPFRYEEIKPFFGRAAKILQLFAPQNFGFDSLEHRFASTLFAKELRTAVFIMRAPLRFGEHYRALLAKSSNVRVYFHGRVTEIEEEQIASVIRHLRIVTLGGKTHWISARHFVLACGGLENPRLLLASRRKTASGIGNQHDTVGRYYMQHPKGLHGIAVVNHEALRGPLYTHGHLVRDVKICGGISFSESFQRQEMTLNHCIMFRPLLSLSESCVAQAYRAAQRAWCGSGRSAARRDFIDLARFTASALRRAAKEHRRGTVFSVLNHMEQIPKRESRLELSVQRDQYGVHQLRTDWRIDSLEKASLCRLHAVVREQLAAHGAGKLESQLDALAENWPITQDSAHHMGATRMYDDPRRGVTDAYGRVHSVRNLYISGNSVFPTGGHANPTFTVVALAVRLADHLKRLCTGRYVVASARAGVAAHVDVAVE